MHSETQIAAGRFAHHGGRLCVARSLFPDVPQPWIDLSTGINPRSYPAPRASLRARNRLPEPTELARLEALAAAAFGVDDPARVVATAGTECALRLLPQIVNLQGSGHRRTDVRLARGCVDTCRRTDADDSPSTRCTTHAERAIALTIVNPNNPDGRIVERARLLELHDSLDRHGGTLIVDEAFADVAPEVQRRRRSRHAARTAAHRAALLRQVLRPGRRASRLHRRRAAASLPRSADCSAIGRCPSDAIAAGLAAYADQRWTHRERAIVCRSLRSASIACSRAAASRSWAARPCFAWRAQRMRATRFAQLLAAGILVRPFDFDPDLAALRTAARSRSMAQACRSAEEHA